MEVIFVVVGIIIVLMLMVFMFGGSSSKTAAGSTSCTPSCTNGNTCGSSGSCMCGTSAACTGSDVCNGTSCEAACTTANCTTPGFTCDATTNLCSCNGVVCQSGQTCQNNTCISPDGADCADGSTCAGGNCYYGKCATSTGSCSTVSDCGGDPTTQDCVNKVCLKKPPAYGCNPGCANNYSCKNGTCVSIDLPECVTTTSPHKCTKQYRGMTCTIGGCDIPIDMTACKTPLDCVNTTGLDSTCVDGYCACGNIIGDNGYGCIGGTFYSTLCNTPGIYSGTDSILTNYTCFSNNEYRCGGQMCSYGQVCNNDRCGSPCTETSCGGGYSCDTTSGLCSCNGVLCTSGQMCVNGSCISTSTGIACSKTNPCATGECYYGYCINSSGDCVTPYNCNDGGIATDCVNGKCLSKPPAYGCSPGCGDGYGCDGGICGGGTVIPDYAFPACATDPTNNICTDGQLCTNNGCSDNVVSCTIDSDCIQNGPDAFCLSGENGSFCASGNSYPVYLEPYYQSFDGTIWQ